MGGPWWGTRATAMGAWAVAGWPVWRWYVARVGDGSDEPWGLVALVVALALVPWRRLRERLPLGAAGVAGSAAVAVIFGYDVLPPIVRGGLWMLALAALLGGAERAPVCAGLPLPRTQSPGRWPRDAGPGLARAGLLVLSLPVVATAQFYLGYPLRALTAACSVPLLHGLGFEVARQGTALHWAGETVLVDAPCSGIQMLWTGLFTACALAAMRGLGDRATLRLLRWAGGVVAVANLLRCVALFLVEVRSGTPPRWLHEGIGLVLFGTALGAVAWAAGREAADNKAHGREPYCPEMKGAGVAGKTEPDGRRVAPEGSEGCSYLGWGGCYRSPAPTLLIALLGLLLVGAAARPIWAVSPKIMDAAAAFPGWPETFEGRTLIPLAASERETRFAAGFPGRVATFTDGERTILFRWVARETRKLHPALHCLRGLGYAVEPGPVWRDPSGSCWGTTEARRGGRTLRVRERIVDGAGAGWTDVSAWWWDAWRGRSTGPWWAVTLFES